MGPRLQETDVSAGYGGVAAARRPGGAAGTRGRSLGATWAPGGKPRIVLGFTIVDGMVAAIDIHADPETFGQLDLEIAND